MRKCSECGKEFVEVGEATECAVCDLEIKAREPTQFLKDMRAVFAGKTPETHNEKFVKAMMDRHPDRFLSRLEDAEMEWREQVARVAAGSVRESEGSVADEQSETVESLIEELLAEGAS